MPSIVALIPARAGSKRIPGKNTKDFFGHPLIAYTIHAAKESGIFDAIVVSTDSGETAQLSYDYGATHCPKRSAKAADDDSPDIAWIREVLVSTTDSDVNPIRQTQYRGRDTFAILRPTSPFRTASTIRRAWDRFQRSGCDSIRAVEWARQNPHKMWIGDPHIMFPAFRGANEYRHDIVPWHSCPTQSLPQYYIQNASLEIAWTRCVTEQDSISGETVAPFFTEGYEGFDLNTPDDWERAASLVDRGLVALPALGAQTPATPQK